MTSEYWILLGAVVAVALAVFVLVRVWLRRRGPQLGQALADVSIDRLQNVLVPDGMGGQIQLEHVLLTAHGLVVIDVKAFEGTIFASDRMAEWTVIGAQRPIHVPESARHALRPRRGAAPARPRRARSRDSCCSPRARTSRRAGRRTSCCRRSSSSKYRKPDAADLERLLVAFAPHWERVKSAIEPVTAGARAKLR